MVGESMKYAYVFPGQGCQFVGMGRDIYDNFASAKEIYKQADESLGFPLSKLCFEGPEEELGLTINSQPAIVTTSIAWVNILLWQRPMFLIFRLPYIWQKSAGA